MKGEKKITETGRMRLKNLSNEWRRKAKRDPHWGEWLLQSVCTIPQMNLSTCRKQGSLFSQQPFYSYFNVTPCFAYFKTIFLVLRVPNISPSFPSITMYFKSSVLVCLSSRHIFPCPSFASMLDHKSLLPGFCTGLSQSIWILISWPLEDKQKIKIVLNSQSLH